MLLAVPAAAGVRLAARRRVLPVTPLNAALLLLAVQLGVSCYATYDLRVSLPNLSTLLYGLALFFATAEWAAAGPGRLRAAAAAAAVGGLALGIFGALGTHWPAKLPGLGALLGQVPAWFDTLSREAGGFNANVVGAALAFFVPLQGALLGWAWRAGPRGPRGWALRAALAALLAATGALLALTQSRGAIAAALGGLAVVAWLALGRRLQVALAGLAVAGVVVLAVVGPQTVSETLAARYGTEFSLTDLRASAGDRLTIWSHALFGVEDFPFTGMGVGTFRTILPVLYPIGEATQLLPGRAALQHGIDHAHNQLLQAALDLGLPGLVAWLALALGAAALAVQARRRAPDAFTRALATGLGAALLANFAYGMVDAVVLVSKPGVVFWPLLGLLAAAWAQAAAVPPVDLGGRIVRVADVPAPPAGPAPPGELVAGGSRGRASGLERVDVQRDLQRPGQELQQHPHPLARGHRPEEQRLQPRERPVRDPHRVAGREGVPGQPARPVDPRHVLLDGHDDRRGHRPGRVVDRQQPQHPRRRIDPARAGVRQVSLHEQIAGEEGHGSQPPVGALRHLRAERGEPEQGLQRHRGLRLPARLAMHRIPASGIGGKRHEKSFYRNRRGRGSTQPGASCNARPPRAHAVGPG